MLSLEASNVVPLILSLLPLYLLYTILVPTLPPAFSPSNPLPNSASDGYNWIPLRAQESLLLRDYTPRELAPFDGRDGGRILLAIKGEVFDVSHGKQFYGPGEISLRGLRDLR